MQFNVISIYLLRNADEKFRRSHCRPRFKVCGSQAVRKRPLVERTTTSKMKTRSFISSRLLTREKPVKMKKHERKTKRVVVSARESQQRLKRNCWYLYHRNFLPRRAGARPMPKQTSIYELACVIKFRLPASRITARATAAAYNARQDRKTRAFFSTILTADFIAPRFTDFRLRRSATCAGENVKR